MSFTNKELTYLSDTDFLLTKRNIQDKINQVLVETEAALKNAIKDQEITLPAHVKQTAGKISKGENYQGLPYQILDFPRFFSRSDIYAYRVMCWWGHFFSMTYHLQGASWEANRERLSEKRSVLCENKVMLCVHHSPWEYHASADNYRPAADFSEQQFQAYWQERTFAKLAVFLPLDQSGKVPERSTQFFCTINRLLED